MEVIHVFCNLGQIVSRFREVFGIATVLKLSGRVDVEIRDIPLFNQLAEGAGCLESGKLT